MTAIGVDARTFRVLSGWDHVVQSVAKILTTEIGSRVQRRDFGSAIPRLLDKPQNAESLTQFYMATAEALYPRKVNGRWYGEPRFLINRVAFTAHVPGEVGIALFGDYAPKGHLGDFTAVSPMEITYSVNRIMDQLSFEAVD